MAGAIVHGSNESRRLRPFTKQAGAALIGEITELVTKKLALSDETVNELHGGRGPQSKLEHHLGWARTYLKQHGLITNLARGVWVLTPRGRYEVAPEGARIRREFRQSSESARWRHRRPKRRE